MQYFEWNKQCPYAALCNNVYPAAPYQGPYFTPWNDSFYAEEGQVENRELYDADTTSGEFTRAQRDVERVIPLALQRSAVEINQMTALGMPPSLIAYLVREMVEYIDRNFDNYDKSASYNITQAAESIKTRYYWIFNILRIYGVPFETQKNFLNNVVITAVRNLRLPQQGVAAPNMR